MKFLKPTIYAFIFLSCLLVSFKSAHAANTCLWNGNTSTAWNTAANWSNCGGVVPTSADDVVFDNLASTYTLNIAGSVASVKSFVTTGTTNAVTVTNTGSQIMYLYGNFILKSGDSFTIAGLWIENTATITQGGATLTTGYIYLYISSYPTITLGSDLNIGSGTFLMWQVVFNTNNYSITCGTFGEGGSYSATLTLNNSTLNVSNVSFGTAPTVTSTTHTINITTDSATANNFAGKAWGIVNFKSNASAARAHLITPGSGASFVQFNIDQLTDRRDVSVSFDGDFSVSQSSTWKSGGAGNDDPTYRLLIKSNTTGTQKTATVTAAGQTLTFTDVDFQDIKVATTNSPTITKTRVGDAGGNTGGATITSAPKTVYLDAGTTDNVYFSDNYWSTSSGGGSPSLNNYPLPQDTAIIDNNSFDDLYNIIWATAPRTGAIDASTLTESQNFYSNTIHYGSLILSTAITIGGYEAYNFDARVAGTLSISYTTRDLYNNITINSYGGVVQLSSSMLMATTILTLTRGTIDLNGNTLTTKVFSSTGTNTRELKATGGGNIYITGTTGTVLNMTDPTSLTVSNAPAVTLNGALTGNATFAGGGKTFGNFWNHTTGAYAVQFTGSNVFNNFKVDAGRTMQFTAGTTTTVGSLTATGTSGSPITLGSITAASHTLTKTGGGTATCDYCNISYSTATPASTWYATNSTNNGNNSGWTFATIYRSAAPDDNGDNNIAALATGGSNAVTISGSTATFTTALPDNIGVGDVLQYDSNNNGSIGAGDAPAFISGRTSSTVYTVKTAAGGIPTARAADTTWSIFRAYTSLFNAEAGTENTAIDSNLRNFDTWSGGKDISTSGEQWNIALYANGTTADTTAVAVSGWTTSASNYIRVYTPYLSSEVGTSQRHNGKWDDTKYRLEISNTVAISSTVDYIRIDGLQVKLTSNAGANIHAISVRGSATGNTTDIRVTNNIVQGVLSGSASNNYGILSYQGTAGSNVIKIANNIVYGFNNSSSGVGIGMTGVTSYIYNNTVVNSYIGYFSSGSTTTLINNIVKGSGDTNAYNGTFASGSDYNATDGTDSVGTGTHNRVSQTFSFVNADGNDFHLASTDAGAKDFGVNLSADANLAFSTDIDGDTRSGLWDIGADENTSVVINIQRNVNFGRNVNIK
jgi:hypothetical protein